MASASVDRTLRMWDLESFEQVCCTPPDSGQVQWPPERGLSRSSWLAGCRRARRLRRSPLRPARAKLSGACARDRAHAAARQCSLAGTSVATVPGPVRAMATSHADAAWSVLF